MKCLISGDVKLSVWDNPRAWCILRGIAKSNKQHNTSHDAVHIGLCGHTPPYWKGTGLVWYCPQWRMESDAIDKLRRGLSARSFSDITHCHTHIQKERRRWREGVRERERESERGRFFFFPRTCCWIPQWCLDVIKHVEGLELTAASQQPANPIGSG